MKQSTRHLKLAYRASQGGIIVVWSEPKWSRHCTDLVHVHYLSAPRPFILCVDSSESDKAGAEFPFPWKHFTLPRLTVLLKRTEMCLSNLPSPWPFLLPTPSYPPPCIAWSPCHPVIQIAVLALKQEMQMAEELWVHFLSLLILNFQSALVFLCQIYFFCLIQKVW